MPVVVEKRRTFILEKPGRRAVFHVPGELSKDDPAGTVTVSRWAAGELESRVEHSAKSARWLYQFLRSRGYEPW